MDAQGHATFGAALRAAIVAAGYTQARLAHALNIDAGQVSRWTNDRTIPHSETVARIEQLLDVDLSSSFSASAVEYELYVSAPLTGLKTQDIATHHTAVAEVVAATKAHVNSLYWPGEQIRGLSDLPAPDIATERNMKVLAECSAFLYLQFSDIVRPSSALIELGIALGRRLHTTIIVQTDVEQPFMLDNFGGVAASLNFLPKARIYTVRSVVDACSLVTRNGRELLGLG
jgi:transcriptional regulator with XRE-family HTH domain